MIVYGQAVRIRLGGRSRGVEQDEDAEIASKFAAFQVDAFCWRVAGAQIDEKVDERLDVQLVAIGTTAQHLGAEADARQTTAQHVVVRNACGGCDLSGGRQREVDHPAPIRAIAVVVFVPFRIERAANTCRSAGIAVIGETDPRGHRPGMCSRRLCAPNCANLHFSAGNAVPGGTRAAKQFAEIVRKRPGVKQRTRKQFEDLALPRPLPVAVVVSLGQVDRIELQTQLFVGGLRARSGREGASSRGGPDSLPNHSGGSGISTGLLAISSDSAALAVRGALSGRNAAASGTCLASSASTR